MWGSWWCPWGCHPQRTPRTGRSQPPQWAPKCQSSQSCWAPSSLPLRLELLWRLGFLTGWSDSMWALCTPAAGIWSQLLQGSTKPCQAVRYRVVFWLRSENQWFMAACLSKRFKMPLKPLLLPRGIPVMEPSNKWVKMQEGAVSFLDGRKSSPD